MNVRDKDEQLLVRYLLGELSEEEQSQLEERYFADDDFYSEVRATERDLIDDYVRGRLSGRRHEQFESYFMASPERREKVELARSFQGYLAEVGANAERPALASRGQSLLGFLGIRYPAMQVSFAVATMVLTAGVALLVVHNVRPRHGLDQAREERMAEEQRWQQQLSSAHAQIEQLKLEHGRNGSAQLEPVLSGRRQGPIPVATLMKPPSEIAALEAGGASVVGFAGQKTIGLIGPSGTFVQDERPTFRWQRYPGATGYEVKVDSDHSIVEVSEPQSGTEWRATRRLPRGETYSWEVTAMKDGQEIAKSSKAKFKVLEQAKADFLEHAKEQYAASHLTLGVFYAQAGLLDDAEREFQVDLDSENSSRDRELVQQLLRSVRASRRPEPGAKAIR